ncbi:MAG: T9SS type A sorting domain-containing protein [Aureispira sp.]|nr:T9SS type A sorting domain-containing protein [Aureispira sp.]
MKLYTTLFIIYISIAQLIGQGAYTPANADYSYPRVYLDSADANAIRNSLYDPAKTAVYNSIWGTANATPPVGNDHYGDRRQRAYIARDAAYVAFMKKAYNNGTNTLTTLSAVDSAFYVNKSIDLLENLNDTVGVLYGEWNVHSLWQFTCKELPPYLIAYDLLKGIGVPDDSLVLAKTNLQSFAGQLCEKSVAKYPVPGAGNILGDSIDFFHQEINNHTIMTAATLGLAGIVLSDATSTDVNYQANTWINVGMYNVDASLFEIEPVAGSYMYVWAHAADRRNGGYSEGPSYWTYCFQNVIPLMRAMGNFLPDGNYTYSFRDRNNTTISASMRNPYYDQAYYDMAQWMLDIRMPDGSYPAIHDTPHKYKSNYYTIMGQQYNIPYDGMTYNSSSVRGQYLAMDIEDTVYTEPLFKALPLAGDLVFRSTYDDPSGVYMHLIGKNRIYKDIGYGHPQMDGTSFELYYNKEILAFDPGYPGYWERKPFTLATNHNLVLVDGMGPDTAIRVSFIPGEVGLHPNNFVEIENFFDQPSVDYGELRAAWHGADVVRKTLFLHNRYFIMADVLSSTTSHDYTYQLHGNGLLGALPNSSTGRFIPNFANNRALYTRSDTTHLLAYISTRDGMPTYSHAADSLVAGSIRPATQTLVTKSNVDSTEFLSILYPFTNSDSAEIITISANRLNGAIVKDSPYLDYVVLRPDHYLTAIVTGIDTLETDANIAFYSMDSTTNYAVQFLENGQELGLNGKTLIKSDRFVDLALEQVAANQFTGHINKAAIVEIAADSALVAVQGNVVATYLDLNTGRTIVEFGDSTDFILEYGAAPILNTQDLSLNSAGLSVQPNPARTVVVVEHEYSGNDKKATLDVYDTGGSLLRTEVVNTQRGINQWNLDVETYANGVYVVRLSTSDKTYITKFVKK